jgi:iron uptake system EfeUOB component EfeO/EfeM
MKRVKIITASSLFILLMASCSSVNKLNRRLQGSWNISSYSEQHVDEQEASAVNIGSMTFNDDNSGTKKISYRILSNQIADTSRFVWSNTNKTVTIKGENSAFAKTWIILKNQNKKQSWTSTDGKGNVQSIVLQK